MESYEHVCKVALEYEGYAVTGNLKFPIKRQTRKKGRVEYQTHGYEIDLVGARRDRLVLAQVKSFFGSSGVAAKGLGEDEANISKGIYKFFNDQPLREAMCAAAANRFGYDIDQIQLRFYAGKFKGNDEIEIRKNLSSIGVKVISVSEVIDTLVLASNPDTYFDDPVLMTVKAIKAANRLAIIS